MGDQRDMTMQYVSKEFQKSQRRMSAEVTADVVDLCSDDDDDMAPAGTEQV